MEYKVSKVKIDDVTFPHKGMIANDMYLHKSDDRAKCCLLAVEEAVIEGSGQTAIHHYETT